MVISKKSQLEIINSIEQSDLELINSHAKKELKSDDIFTFSVLLCDNEIDRDNEYFSDGAIYALSELFVGKTGLFDHEWSAKGQVARIYKTQVLQDGAKKSAAGGRYLYLKGSAYMMRTPQNESLIAEIEGGIKKEVSVGCSVRERLCSICGGELGHCNHIKGEIYGGQVCCGVLNEPTDAYEWSFVAVPSQKNAGVIKRYRDCAEENSDGNADGGEYAALGKKYMKALVNETVSLGIAAEMGFSRDFLEKTLRTMDERSILEFKSVFSKKVNEKYPIVFQLEKKQRAEKKFSDEEFII